MRVRWTWLTLPGLLAWTAHAEEPAAGEERVFAGPIGEGPWKFGKGCASTFDDDGDLGNGWYEYYQLDGEKFLTPGFLGIGAVKTWQVSVDTASTSHTCSPSPAPQVVFTRAQTVGVTPKNLGAKIAGAVKGGDWHAAGEYQVSAESGGSTVDAQLYITRSGNTRREDFCIPTGFSWPTRATVDRSTVSWTINRIGGGGFPDEGCPKDHILLSYVVTVNVPAPQ